MQSMHMILTAFVARTLFPQHGHCSLRVLDGLLPPGTIPPAIGTPPAPVLIGSHPAPPLLILISLHPFSSA